MYVKLLVSNAASGSIIGKVGWTVELLGKEPSSLEDGSLPRHWLARGSWHKDGKRHRGEGVLPQGCKPH